MIYPFVQQGIQGIDTRSLSLRPVETKFKIFRRINADVYAQLTDIPIHPGALGQKKWMPEQN